MQHDDISAALQDHVSLQTSHCLCLDEHAVSGQESVVRLWLWTLDARVGLGIMPRGAEHNALEGWDIARHKQEKGWAQRAAGRPTPLRRPGFVVPSLGACSMVVSTCRGGCVDDPANRETCSLVGRFGTGQRRVVKRAPGSGQRAAGHCFWRRGCHKSSVSIRYVGIFRRSIPRSTLGRLPSNLASCLVDRGTQKVGKTNNQSGPRRPLWEDPSLGTIPVLDGRCFH